jgi:hypothetical protein
LKHDQKHQANQDHHPDEMNHRLSLGRDTPSSGGFDKHEQDTPTIQGGDGQQVCQA